MDMKNLNCEELNAELNKFAKIFYGDDKRKVMWHEFRQFPYILHNPNNAADYAGTQENYTVKDLLFIRIVKSKVQYTAEEKYSFMDKSEQLEYITAQLYSYDANIHEIPIDELFRLMNFDIEKMKKTR